MTFKIKPKINEGKSLAFSNMNTLEKLDIYFCINYKKWNPLQLGERIRVIMASDNDNYYSVFTTCLIHNFLWIKWIYYIMIIKFLWNS